jgi:MFS family permease
VRSPSILRPIASSKSRSFAQQLNIRRTGGSANYPDDVSGRIHRAWIVALATFVVILFSASVRGAITLLIEPLMKEFDWRRGSVTAAASINLALFGLMGPFASALMIRFGLRRVVTAALFAISVGSVLSTQATAVWHLWLSWGVVMGIGQGCLATVLAANVASAWFVEKRGTVTGALTAAGSVGTLVFIPLNERLVSSFSWRFVCVTIAAATLLAVPLVVGFIRTKPEDIGLSAYGAPTGYVTAQRTGNPIVSAFTTLRDLSQSAMFWLLLGSFTVCGISTSGLIQVHFVPAAIDHGITQSAAAKLFVLIGVFDLVGAIGSGWLTDRFDPRLLLFGYYGFRAMSLFLLDSTLGHGASNAAVWGVVMFYGLDWIATVPPTIALANQIFGPQRGSIVYGWLFAGHQLGGAAAAWLAAQSREATGSYATSFVVAGICCLGAAFGVLRIKTGNESAVAVQSVSTSSAG